MDEISEIEGDFCGQMEERDVGCNHDNTKVILKVKVTFNSEDGS